MMLFLGYQTGGRGKPQRIAAAAPYTPAVTEHPHAGADRLGEDLGSALAACAEAMRPVVEQIAHGLRVLLDSPAWREFAEWAASPEGRAVAEALERGDVRPLLSCHCLCVAVHRDRPGLCNGTATGTVVRVSELLGRVEIRVCGPCRTAQLAAPGPCR
jgi:hypothetical protein